MKKLISYLQIFISITVIMTSLLWVSYQLYYGLSWQSLEQFVAIITVIVTLLISIFSKRIADFTSKSSHTMVFLSYSSKIEKEAILLANSLRKKGIRVWLASEQLKAGQSVWVSIENALSSSDKVVVLVTENQSSYVNKELELAMKYKIPIIPVLMEDAELPSQLRDMYFVDFRTNKEKQVEKLLGAVKG